MTSFVGRWQIVHVANDAKALHSFDPPTQQVPTLVVASVTNSALVLGSTQPHSVADADAARRHGQDLVRRRSGGGAVLVSPGGQVWIDVWIPRGDPLWDDDVVGQAVPIGRAWAAAIDGLGHGPCTVHEAGVQRTTWSDLVCFAGRGPGEVFSASGRKLVGISQRRTRQWVRLQTLVYRRWDSASSLAGLVLSIDERADATRMLDRLVGVVDPADEPGSPDIWERVAAALR